MKTLKIYLLIVCTGLSAISCSNDDSDEIKDNTLQEKIIGTWQFHKFIEDGEEVDLGNCVSQSTYKFAENGILTITFVQPDEFNEEECNTGTSTGEWEYISGNNFKFTTNGQSGLQEIMFSENYSLITVTVNGSSDILTLKKID